jgi:hypothetical protein
VRAVVDAIKGGAFDFPERPVSGGSSNAQGAAMPSKRRHDPGM